MQPVANFAVLAMATGIAAAAAFGMAWAFLRGAFLLMQPAGRPARPIRLHLVPGTRAVVRGFAAHR